jgi:hypothetical protein
LGSGVSNHSDPEVATWGFTPKALELVCQNVNERLPADFQRLFGVAVPTPGSGPTFVQEACIWQTQVELNVITAEFEKGAAAKVAAQIPDTLARGASLAVVQSLLIYVQDGGGIAIGGYAASAMVNTSRRWVSTLICETDIGRATQWRTPSDFFIIGFGFFVWVPHALAAATADRFTLQQRFTLEPCHWPPP